MTTNVPPEYTKAELRYRAAKDPEEKLVALKEMMVLVPKHKGTEKLRVELKKRLAKVQKEAQKKPKATKSSGLDHVDKEGAGQVVLVGMPNCGKSALLDAVTNAEPEVADYPYSTFKPTVGMMAFEDIQVQLIDLPPLSEFAEPWLFSLIRNSDAVALMVDLSETEPIEQLMEILDYMENANIHLVRPEKYDKHYEGPGVQRKAVVIASKADFDEDGSAFSELVEAYGEEFPISPASIVDEEAMDKMKRALFDLLEILRIYSKKPGEKPSYESPYILPLGSTMIDVVKAIHYEMVDTLNFAKIWGSAEFEGQRVERDYVVSDGDVIEVHA